MAPKMVAITPQMAVVTSGQLDDAVAGIGEAQNGLIEVIIIGGPGGYHDDKGRNVSKTQHIDQRIGQIIDWKAQAKSAPQITTAG